MKNNSEKVPGEGIIHGPFPTPDIAEDKIGSQWMMNWAENDPALYQLLMQREAMYDDVVNHRNSELINPNLNRITGDIIERRGLVKIAKIREVKPPTNKRRIR